MYRNVSHTGGEKRATLPGKTEVVLMPEKVTGTARFVAGDWVCS